MTPEQYAEAIMTCPQCGVLQEIRELTDPQPDVRVAHLQCDPCWYAWRIEMVAERVDAIRKVEPS